MALGIIARLYGRDKAQEIADLAEYEWQSDSTHDPFATLLNQGKIEQMMQMRVAL